MANESLNDLVHSNNPTHLDKLTPQIYVACLAAYNAGKLHGSWINATQEVEKIHQEILKMLSNSPIPNAEEWAIYCHNFGTLTLSENEDLEVVQSMAVFLVEHGPLGAGLLGYYGDIDSARNAMENHYEGEYENQLEFAIQLFDDCYMGAIPEAVQGYIDYASFKRDIFLGEFFLLEVEGKGHVFSRN
jgi:antirestriction protein